MKIDLSRIITIDSLIQRKCTGSPEELSRRLGVSKRTLHYYIGFMKDDMSAPICYNKQRSTYYYSIEGGVLFAFQKRVSTLSCVLALVNFIY